MSRWFRHYAGMMRDEKLVSVAVRSKQSIERVLWVWGAILESAAETNDNGKFALDTAEAAYFLRTDQTDLDCIVRVLEELGRISENRVVNWGNRQFSSDRSADRTRAYRDKQKRNSDNDKNVKPSGDNVTLTPGDSDVTSQGCHGDAPETDTELDTEKKVSSPKRVRTRYPEDFEEFWKAYPTDQNMSKSEAFSAWQRLPDDDRKLATASLTAFREFCRKDATYRPIHAVGYLQKRRFEGHANGAAKDTASEDIPGFYAAFNSPELEAWSAYERETRGRAGARDRAGGWRYPTRWPPGHDPPVSEVAA